jgi:hypothetical protein
VTPAVAKRYRERVMRRLEAHGWQRLTKRVAGLVAPRTGVDSVEAYIVAHMGEARITAQRGAHTSQPVSVDVRPIRGWPERLADEVDRRARGGE